MTQDSIRPYKSIEPQLAEGAYVDPHAVVIGDVHLGQDVSVWPMTVIRGDVNRIRIGHRSNIQDGSVIHVTRPQPDNPEGYPTILGEDVTVGHKVMLHGCQIGNRVLIGMGAIILDGAEIQDEVIVAAGALVPPGKVLEKGYLYKGAPVKQARPVKPSEIEHFMETAQKYIDLKNDYSNRG